MARPPLPLVRQAETLAAAAAGGALMAWLGIPAGWLSGAMAATAILTGAGRGAPVAAPIRLAALALAGLAVGSAVTPEMLESFAHYPASIAMMAVSLIASTAISAAIILGTTMWSRPTALFASIPGALSYVLALAPNAGADMARVAVVQLTRIFVLIALAPILVGGSPAAVGGPPAGAIDGPIWILGILAVGAPLGLLFEKFGVSAGVLFGPMLVAAVAHGSGLAPGRPPLAMQIVGQVLIGAWSGSRFSNLDLSLLRASIVPIFGSLTAAIVTAAAFAFLAHWALDLPYADALVAFAPGGLEAMTLLAFSLGLDPLYVGSHHLARFILISLSLPFVLRLVLGRAPKG